jgi:hypothetical protein
MGASIRSKLVAQVFALGLCGVLASTAISMSGCAEQNASGGRRRIVRDEDTTSPPTSGIPPDKQAEIQLFLQQRNPSTLKCYSDVLNEKKTREFKGTVIVVLTLEPSGSMSKASEVKILGGSMTDKEVTTCLIEKLKDFEFPELPAQGSMQYTYRFEPAY